MASRSRLSSEFPQVPASSRKFPQVPRESRRFPTFPAVSRSLARGSKAFKAAGLLSRCSLPVLPFPAPSSILHAVILSPSPSLSLPLPPSPSPPFLSPSAFLDFLGIIAGRAFHGIARSFHLIGADPRVGCGFLANSPGNTFSKILEAST